MLSPVMILEVLANYNKVLNSTSVYIRENKITAYLFIEAANFSLLLTKTKIQCSLAKLFHG